MLIVLSTFALAEETPPSLDNHQFYGDIHWDATSSLENVIFKLNDKEFVSVIELTPGCGENTCSGRYGYNVDNILRVSGKSGDKVLVFVDGVKVQEVAYESFGVTKLDIDLATLPLDKPGCEQDWKCGSWSACVDDKQTQTCNDANKCEEDALQKTEEKTCGEAVVTDNVTEVSCTYEWDCTPWGSCTSNKKTRTCTRTDNCDGLFSSGTVTSVVKIDKPSVSKFCFVEGIGELPTKKVSPPEVEKKVVEEEGLSIWVYVGGFLIFLALVVIIYFVFFRKKEEMYGV